MSSRAHLSDCCATIFSSRDASRALLGGSVQVSPRGVSAGTCRSANVRKHERHAEGFSFLSPMGTTRIDLVGRRFGLLTVTSLSHSENACYWRCACDCGVDMVRRGSDLLARERRGNIQSCGCHKNRVSGESIRCTKCRQFKVASDFRKDAGTATGLHGHCRHCQDEWRSKNKQLLAHLNKDWASRNVDRCFQVARAHRQKNSHLNAARESKRRADKVRATPVWADLQKIAAFYAEAKRLSLTVDHIVPLNSDLVCGLHVEHNLQLLTKPENCSKNNRYWPDMP